MADDLGYADLGCYGRHDMSTPNIDRMARQGCGCSRPMPTRRYVRRRASRSSPADINIVCRWDWRNRWQQADVGLPPEHPTLPSLLRQAGYATSLVGKWHLGMPPKFGPSRSGYDRFFGIRSGAVITTRTRTHVASMTCGTVTFPSDAVAT